MQLLLLHGLAGAPEDWSATLAHLPGAQALTPRIDYLSMGACGLTGLAASVLNSLPAWFEPQRAVVAGNSLGGALALLCGGAFRHSVLVAPHVQMLRGRLDRGVHTVRRELERIFHAPQELHALQVREYERLWHRASGTRLRFSRLRHVKQRVAAFDLEQQLAQSVPPPVLVCGRSDALTPLSVLQSLSSRYPELELHILDHCGHAVPLEQPASLAGIIQGAFRKRQRPEIMLEKRSKKFLPKGVKPSRSHFSERASGKKS